MARTWVVKDSWEGGGYLAGGSFDSASRFRSVNMQRYQNGSIGPRPQWAKQTQSTDGLTTIPTTTSAAIAPHGIHWTSWGQSGWTFGTLLIPIGETSDSRIVRLRGSGLSAIYTATGDQLHEFSVGPASRLAGNDAYGIQGQQMFHDAASLVYLAGSTRFDPNALTFTNATPRTINAATFYPRKLAFYRNRMYGIDPYNGSNPEYIVYSQSADPSDFSTEDSGDFRLAAAPSGFTAMLPRGLWALGSGLLIFATEGQGRTTFRSGYTGQTTPYVDYGRWYQLTGPNPEVGSLEPRDYDIGPMFFSLSIVHEGKLLFAQDRRGYVLADGSTIDKTVMESIRPGGGQDIDFRWLAPTKTLGETALILPFCVTDTDPTDNGSGTADRTGDFYSHGYGAFEWVNGAWTEAQWWHGQGKYPQVTNFDTDRLVAVVWDSSDGGNNFYPQVYTRDVCLNRPSHGSDEWSAGSETAVTIDDSTGSDGAGAATGHMYALLETGEERATPGEALEVHNISVEYDYWNSANYDQECGFEVELLYREDRNFVTHTQPLGNRITPPDTSVGDLPSRARAIVSVPAVSCGTFQLRFKNVVGVAFHAVAIEVENREIYT